MSDQAPSDLSENGVTFCVFAGSFFLSIVIYQHWHCFSISFSIICSAVIRLLYFFFFTHIVQGLLEIKALGQ